MPPDSSPRMAVPEDSAAIAVLLELGEPASDDLSKTLGESVEGLVLQDPDGTLAAAALFSTMPTPLQGACVLRLSAVRVREDRRGQGHGKALMITLANLCIQRGCHGLDWAVDRLDLEARTFFDLLCPDSFQLNRLVYGIDTVGLAKLAEREN